MAFEAYKLDKIAHDLVFEHCDKGAHSQVYKMRTTASLGLERFWGEQLRLYDKRKDIYYPTAASNYWAETWQRFCEILSPAGIELPSEKLEPTDKDAIKRITDYLWAFDQKQRKVALAVLIQLCDCMVWWSQRYKPLKLDNDSQEKKDD
ncbi:hypothetical protein [Coleofasciculus sp.]|uniref:hypothetical protein n=1 Tax=Coleofasciculus sp. TaxID=3100458 RepID=UPI003A2D0646